MTASHDLLMRIKLISRSNLSVSKVRAVASIIRALFFFYFINCSFLRANSSVQNCSTCSLVLILYISKSGFMS